MKTENLDKLLDELASKISTLPRRCHPVGPARVVKYALESEKAAVKLTAFAQVAADFREVATNERAVAAIDSQLAGGSWSGFVRVPTSRVSSEMTDVVNLCEKVMLYYMLKGAGCEAEIAEHRALDVIMEILK